MKIRLAIIAVPSGIVVSVLLQGCRSSEPGLHEYAVFQSSPTVIPRAAIPVYSRETGEAHRMGEFSKIRMQKEKGLFQWPSIVAVALVSAVIETALDPFTWLPALF